MKQIPIYRAKKKDSDEYVYGYYTERVPHYLSGRHYIHFYNEATATYEKIDPTTLAIHFPDMLDSQGNKIFASLSEDWKGGDILDRNGDLFYVIYKSVNGRFEAYEISGIHHLLAHKFHQGRVVGIHK